MKPEAADGRWMRAALALARRGLGTTGINPSVGCLIVKNGVLLGRGRTGAGGRPHAETVALDQARERYGPEAIRGADVYVTLEPCAHHGLTPPCADALIAAAPARVVAPFSDPDARVSGRGFDALRGAGVAVSVGAQAEAAAETLRGYLTRIQERRPFLTLKLAATLDGRIATSSGESRWITGAAARARGHLARAQSDGIILGVGTVLTDDPRLDVRLPGFEGRGPAPIVADSRLQTPLTGALARRAGENGLTLLCRDDADRARIDAFRSIGAEVIPVPVTGDGLLSMQFAMERLAQRGIGALLCEGGGRLAASLLREDLVDEVHWFTAGALIGASGHPSVADFGTETIAEMPRFALIASERIGADTLSIWRPRRE